MSSETPKGPAEERPTEPFARGKITWGRPPQAVFQVGPLPRAGTAPAAAQRSTRPTGEGILSGSMVPPAKSVAEPVTETNYDAAELEPVVEPEAVTPPPESEPIVVAVEPEPLPEPVVAPQEILVEPDAPEPAVTLPPPLSSETKPAAEPRKLPSVVVTPAIYATVGAAIEKVTKKDRWLVFAGIAAVVVTGAFIWLATLPAPQPVDAAPSSLVPDAPPIEAAPVSAEVSIPEASPAPTRAAPLPAAAAPAAPVIAQPRPSTPARAAPIVIAPVEAAPQPYIETAPLVIEPPTPATPAPTNPDAPIATGPQPLN